MSTVLQLYDSCGIVTSLLQVRALFCSNKDLADKHNSLMQHRITLALVLCLACSTVHLDVSVLFKSTVLLFVVACLMYDELSV